MQISKEGDKIIQRASTQEIYYCLKGSPIYSRILLEHKPDSAYSEFLRWLLNNEFLKDQEERLTMKGVAAKFNSDPTKITKWVRQVYEEIFDLNYNNPEPFQRTGIKVTLHLTNYDNFGSFHTCLPVIPRENEAFISQFFNAKVGTNYFWVDKIDHYFENGELKTTLHLKGGFVNKYRKFLLDKALFEERINFHDIFTKYDYELDRELKKI